MVARIIFIKDILVVFKKRFAKKVPQIHSIALTIVVASYNSFPLHYCYFQSNHSALLQLSTQSPSHKLLSHIHTMATNLDSLLNVVQTNRISSNCIMNLYNTTMLFDSKFFVNSTLLNTPKPKLGF
jgi:hypothetical protein